MQTVLHKDGDHYAIVTSAENEQQFREQFASALTEIIDGFRPDESMVGTNLAFEIEAWTKPAYEIVCKLRGYKSDVIEQRTLIAGYLDPDAPFVTVNKRNGTPVAAA